MTLLGKKTQRSDKIVTLGQYCWLNESMKHSVPRVEESLAGGRRLSRDAEGDLLGDVALAVPVQLGAPLRGGSEIRWN